MYQTPDGLMEVRIQVVEFVKQLKGGETLHHKSRIITYVDVRKRKLISLLTTDMESKPESIEIEVNLNGIADTIHNGEGRQERIDFSKVTSNE